MLVSYVAAAVVALIVAVTVAVVALPFVYRLVSVDGNTVTIFSTQSKAFTIMPATWVAHISLGPNVAKKI